MSIEKRLAKDGTPIKLLKLMWSAMSIYPEISIYVDNSS